MQTVSKDADFYSEIKQYGQLAIPLYKGKLYVAHVFNTLDISLNVKKYMVLHNP